MDTNMSSNTNKLRRARNQERKLLEDLRKALLVYKGRVAGHFTIIYQRSKLFKMPKELLDMVLSYLPYRDAIALKDTCSTLHAAIDLPTLGSFFLEPKWFTNTQVKKTLTNIPGRDPTWQPCHLCKRFQPQFNFAADQCFDSKVSPSMHKSSKHHFQRWCLKCGFAAGVYGPGQYIMYRSNWSGIVRRRFCLCGAFMRVYTSCGLNGKCAKCVGDQPRFRASGWLVERMETYT